MTTQAHIQKTGELPSLRLQNKVAVVTGAARGIGRAAAVALAREGADVAGIDINAPVDSRSGGKAPRPEDFAETESWAPAAGRQSLGITLDQRDLPSLRNAAKRIGRE